MSEKKQDGKQAADSTGRPLVIAGIGASTLDSLRRFFSAMAAGQGAAFVLIRHSEDSAESFPLESLRETTTYAVVEAKDGMPVLSDRIHVMPQGKFLNATGGLLTFHEPVECTALPMPIDHFFCSLAVDQGSRALGILLSGTGSDGRMGLSQIREMGGKTLVEDPESAGASEEAKRAIETGAADAVLPAEAMAAAVAVFKNQLLAEMRSHPVPFEHRSDLKVILEILLVKTGHDFRCYKPSTMIRRIRRRVTLVGRSSFSDYIQYLSEHPAEADLLKKDLLIGVTDFFRQPGAWKVLEEKVLSDLIGSAGAQGGIRAWVPGCSTGKEAYSLAMLFYEQMEKAGKKVPLQIFATDSDGAALAAARSGSYPDEEVRESVSTERRKRFFIRLDGRWQITKEIREQVVFAPQNLTSDPPFSRLDLISCRNVLIYIEPDVQKKIIGLFHFALREGGFLFLGSAETIGDREDLFTTVSKKMRIYRRIGVGRRIAAELPVRPSGMRPPPAVHPVIPQTRMSIASAAQQVLLERFSPACVMIDRKFHVLYVHGQIENFLTIPKGELTTRVIEMAREGLQARLRGAVTKCIQTSRPVSVTARVRRLESFVPVKVAVSPLRHPREADGLLLITFEDYRPGAKPRRKTMQDENVQQLEEELKIMREELQSTIEQFESSNDQLKASNEEVTAANEELQSANEELETSKEELQSLNEELNTINARLHEKVEELENAKNDVVNLLSSTNIATVFLDKELNIKRYTPASTRLLSLIDSDAGRPVSDILRRFEDDALFQDSLQVLADLTPISKEVRAEDDRHYIRRITPYRTQDDRIDGVVLTFVDISERKQAEKALKESETRYRELVQNASSAIVRWKRDGALVFFNEYAQKLFGYTADEVIGKDVRMLIPERESTGGDLSGLVQDIVDHPEHFVNNVNENICRDGRRVWMTWTNKPIFDRNGRVAEILAVGTDITELKQAEEALRESEERVRVKLESILSPEGDIGNLDLGDIIDIQAIQLLMNDFYKLAHLPMSILDLEGNILVGVGWQEICTRFHRAHPDTCSHCIESDTQLSAGIPPGEARLYKCKNNMWDIATPILVGGKHMGNIFSGQFFFEGEVPDYDLFRSQAKRYGFDEEKYIAAVEAVPRLSRTAVDTGMSFFMKLADMLSKLSYGNIQLARSLAQRDALMDSLRESREDLNRAQAVAKTGSWRLDVRENKLLWSDEAYRIFGIPKGTPLTYETFISAVHPDDRAYVQHKWTAALKGELYDVEHRIMAGDKLKWVRENAELEFDAEGNLRGGFGTVQDITARRQMEEELRRSRDELEIRVQERTAELKRRAEQLSLLASELTLTEERERRRLAEILHDHLQQLLVGARLSLESLTPQIAEEHQHALRNVCNLLMESIDTSRSLTAELSPPILYQRGLTAALEWLARWMREKYGLDIKLKVDHEVGITQEDIMVLLFQSVRELLFNVVKHARINAAEVRMFREDPEQLRIVVSDRGVGFDPNGMWRESEQTCGFGMFTIRERLELLGGRVEVESKPGQGSSFTLIAPLGKAGALEKVQAETITPVRVDLSVLSSKGAKTEKRIRLLLVDDHIVMRQGLSTMLSGHPDIEIVGEAADGEAAVRFARKFNPDVILMDINMPRMNGIEATRIIHAELPHIRIIGLSMFDDFDIASAVIDAGAVAYLTKAGSTEGLLRAIRGKEANG